MIHVMLTYPELHTNMRYISIPKMILELRAGVALYAERNEEGEDRACTTSASDRIRQVLHLDNGDNMLKIKISSWMI